MRATQSKDLNVLDIIPVLYLTVNTGCIILYYCTLYYKLSSAIIYSNIMHTGTTLRSSRVIGDCGGYRRLFAYLTLFGREGVGRQCAGKGGCIGLYRFVDIGMVEGLT